MPTAYLDWLKLCNKSSTSIDKSGVYVDDSVDVVNIIWLPAIGDDGPIRTVADRRQ